MDFNGLDHVIKAFKEIGRIGRDGAVGGFPILYTED